MSQLASIKRCHMMLAPLSADTGLKPCWEASCSTYFASCNRMVWVKVDDATPSSPITMFWSWIILGILDPKVHPFSLFHGVWSPYFGRWNCTSCTMIFGDTWGYLEHSQWLHPLHPRHLYPEDPGSCLAMPRGCNLPLSVVAARQEGVHFQVTLPWEKCVRGSMCR